MNIDALSTAILQAVGIDPKEHRVIAVRYSHQVGEIATMSIDRLVYGVSPGTFTNVTEDYDITLTAKQAGQ